MNVNSLTFQQGANHWQHSRIGATFSNFRYFDKPNYQNGWMKQALEIERKVLRSKSYHITRQTWWREYYDTDMDGCQ